MATSLKSLPLRSFARKTRSIESKFYGDLTPELPCPFTLDPNKKAQIDKFKQQRLKEYKEFVPFAHDFEVFLQDECHNPKFNLLDQHFQGPYTGHCSAEGTERYQQRESKFSSFFKQILLEEQLNISKYSLST